MKDTHHHSKEIIFFAFLGRMFTLFLFIFVSRSNLRILKFTNNVKSELNFSHHYQQKVIGNLLQQFCLWLLATEILERDIKTI